jgi:dTDP-4-dehydrorhamnose reductase
MPNRDVLILGALGQVGSALKCSIPVWAQVTALSRHDVDFSQPSQLRAILSDLKPKVIINAAAYTAVDKAETNADLAQAINCVAVGVIAEEAQRLGAFLVHYSTDYVFDGKKSTPYEPTDQRNPISVYGKSKSDGEDQITSRMAPESFLLLRTQWVHSPGGQNFVATILRASANQKSLRIVADQVGTPTAASDIAVTTWSAINKGVFGTHHLTNAGAGTWFDFAYEILRFEKDLFPDRKSVALQAIKTEDYPLPAARPRMALLDKSSLWNAFGSQTTHWRDSFRSSWRSHIANGKSV